ncbi:WbqC family protein [Ancylomarina sp.]|uniref:WbqC family protein n=1 Tax=Ancylomarina sp. TaxID=1970196 RepID=UPI0035684A77
MESTVLLSTAYFAPIQYYSKLVQFPNVLIEQFENYSKQSYRNRCNIFGANGALALTIPVVKASSKKILTKDVRISYDTDWQKQHWKGIESAYQSSPFYEYYIDDLKKFFDRRWDFLLDMNLQIQEEICSLIDLDYNIKLTDDYIEDVNQIVDFREGIHPKASKSIVDLSFVSKEYYQVFSDKKGFIENLSILDLLFNMGPDSLMYLEQSVEVKG